MPLRNEQQKPKQNIITKIRTRTITQIIKIQKQKGITKIRTNTGTKIITNIKNNEQLQE